VNAFHLLGHRVNLQVCRILSKDIPKTFCIGFNKTGTTSLHRLFKTLGFHSYHGTRWHDLSNAVIYKRYDCFSDGFPLDWQMLQERYPEARYVLNVRDCKSWIFSRLQYIRRLKSIGRYIGGTSWGIWDETEEAVTSWIVNWHSHHLNVLNFFEDQPNRLLIVNFVTDPDAASHVAQFLGYRRPVKKPCANRKSGHVSDDHEQLLIQACSNLNVPEADLGNDILIPSLIRKDKLGPMRYLRRTAQTSAKTLRWPPADAAD